MKNRNEDFLSKSILNFYTSLYKYGDRMEIFTFYKCKQNFKNSKTMNTNREMAFVNSFVENKKKYPDIPS